MDLEVREDGRIACPFDHLSLQYAQDHPEMLAQLQAQAPLAWSDAYGGFWIASTYELARRLASDGDRLLVGPNGMSIPGHPVDGRLRFVPGEADGEQHDNYRLALNPMFTKEKVDALEPSIVARVARVLDQFLMRGEFDVLNDYLQPLINGVACEHLGLQLERPELFNRAIMEGFRFAGGAAADEVEPEVRERFARAWETLVATVAERRAHPMGDVISHLVQWTDPIFTDDELHSMTLNVILGAADTTATLVSRAILYLDEHRDLRRRFADNPVLIDDAVVDEFLRLITPAHAIARTAAQDIEVQGQTIRAGDRLLMSYWGANHDPKRYPDPYQFDLERGARQHLALSVATHFCLGATLAKRIAAIALRELISRAPNYRLDMSRAEIHPERAGLGRYGTMPALVN